MSSRFAWWVVKSSNKYQLLLYVMLAMLILHPAFDQHKYQIAVFSLLVTAMLVSSFYLFDRSKKQIYMGLALAIPEFILIWWRFINKTWLVEVLQFVFFIAFLIFILCRIYRDILSRKKISDDELRGAICLYLMIGATWSAVYYLIELFLPGAFVLNATFHAVTRPLVWSDMLYFSFTTLSTLGYGDIIPILPLAQSLSIIESTMGLFYIAVVVSKLMSQLVNNPEAQREFGELDEVLD